MYPYLPSVSSSQPAGLVPLQPSAAQPLTPSISSKSSCSMNAVGPTWINSGGVNIDIDNLMISGSKLNNKREPSMNQMAINSPTSPSSKGSDPNNPWKSNLFQPFK
ncbi:hypothetical protein RUM44_001793 [Polyplax serrata]|uniref:Uncharacterized protein n=1 Tax=Polyplax serrata TaxID=468196 RepID=A0ABR1AL21_POLSC